MRASSSCGEQGLLFVVAWGRLFVGAPLGVEPGSGAWTQWSGGSVVGGQAQLPWGLWNLPGPGMEPMSPGLARGILNH